MSGNGRADEFLKKLMFELLFEQNGNNRRRTPSPRRNNRRRSPSPRRGRSPMRHNYDQRGRSPVRRDYNDYTRHDNYRGRSRSFSPRRDRLNDYNHNNYNGRYERSRSPRHNYNRYNRRSPVRLSPIRQHTYRDSREPVQYKMKAVPPVFDYNFQTDLRTELNKYKMVCEICNNSAKKFNGTTYNYSNLCSTCFNKCIYKGKNFTSVKVECNGSESKVLTVMEYINDPAKKKYNTVLHFSEKMFDKFNLIIDDKKKTVKCIEISPDVIELQ